MSDKDIITLKRAVSMAAEMGSFVAWCPDSATCKRVLSVTSAPTAEEEPGEVAYISGGYRGDYVALYNAELGDFIVATPLDRIEGNPSLRASEGV